MTAIRGIAELSLLPAVPKSPTSGQWIILVGPNGVGKTTLLRATALALRDLSNPKIWPKGSFNSPWRSHEFEGSSSIKIVLSADQSFSAAIEIGVDERFAQNPLGDAAKFPLFAYGCRRGSALGGAAREVDTGLDDGPEIATLFDDAASLIHAETWLTLLHGSAVSQPAAYRDFFESIRITILKLLELDNLFIRDRQIFVSGQRVGTGIPFSSLSDGYLTTAGWFLDLIARWSQRALEQGIAVDGSFSDRMNGLVLVDEIDLHLHPQWQADIISRIKALLPRMSFIVTTHNPLTLLGAQPEEIWALSSSRAGNIQVEQGIDAPMLLTGAQIFSQYFGVSSTFPHQIGEKLQRYGLLSSDSRRTDSEQVELTLLKTELYAAGVEPGWDEVARVAAIEPTKPARVVAKKRTTR